MTDPSRCCSIAASSFRIFFLLARPLWLILLLVSISHAAPPQTGGRLILPHAPRAKSTSPTLVKVNGDAITTADFDQLSRRQRLSREQQTAKRKDLLQQLIDQRLLLQFLKTRKLIPKPEEVAEQWERLQPPSTTKQSKSPSKDVSLDTSGLKQELILQMAWSRYFEIVASPAAVREHFHKHRQEFDGTEVRVSHLVLVVATDRDNRELVEAEARLKAIRQEILDKKISFADAARKYSQGPSREQGGDVGFISYRGSLPEAVSTAAFQLKTGEVSDVIRSPFGVHLCQVVDRKPGEISLEDARPQVLRRFSEEIWRSTVAELRAHAKIDWINAGASTTTAEPPTAPASTTPPLAPRVTQ